MVQLIMYGVLDPVGHNMSECIRKRGGSQDYR